jgi:hypothetical protein
MTTEGEFKYIEGWFTVIRGKSGLLERIGPFATEQEAREEREKRSGVVREG